MKSTLVRDEQLRLRALEQYEILDTPADSALDDIARLAAQICNAPAVAIGFLDSDRIWFKSHPLWQTSEFARTAFPGDETLQDVNLYEIPDLSRNKRFGADGIEIDGSTYRFYAGAPLITPEGARIGLLCILDTVPRTLNEQQVLAMEVLSRQIVTRLELTTRMRTMDRVARTRQRVETALTVERNFVSAVLDTVGALVVVLDTAGRVVRFNRACEVISGYQVSDLMGQPLWQKLIPEEDVEDSIATFESIAQGNFPATFENFWRTREGSLRHIAWTATGLLDEQNEVAFIIATGIDVTLQREAEATLRESEARYRQLIEGSLGMVFTHAEDGTLISVNSYGAASLGYSIEEMVGRPLGDFVPEDEADSLGLYLREIGSSGEAKGELRLCHRNGDTHVLAYRNRLVRLDARTAYVLGFGIDITEKVRAEERLRVLRRQSDSILASVGDGILGIDLSGSITVANPAGAQILGYKPQDLLGLNLHDTIHHTRADGSPNPHEGSKIQEAVHLSEPVRVSDEIFWRKDGTSVPVDYVATPLLDDGEAVGVVVAFADTTARRELDRMKDEFVSTVSHELRTPLTSLRAALGMVASGVLQTRPDKARQMLDIAVGNTDRLINLVNDILELERIGSGKAELHQANVSIGELCHRAAELQQTSAAKAGIRFRFQIENVHAWADPDRVLQLLTNLISNAIKFSPEGSEILLAAHNEPDGEVCIQVQDQGRGIPEDKLELIFERFQQVDASDSRAKGGTGLGLAICRSIVQQHGGDIWVESALGRGSTFFFTLPSRPSSNLR
ncbi:PAS domain S-box protein [Terriglobus tenax]|uniref:PAS domain S-box protein n=1 Tax=Terriglobus tenax TaxID=1111115 RepID=UPI0021E0B32C|nr:PAS domain S-box protein [Terriglobus tenax]